MLFGAKAFAISSSSGALRLEDEKRGKIVIGAERAAIHEGEIWKSVVLLWGNLEISGEVDEVVILSGNVHFNRNSKLKKSLVVMGGAFESDPGAQIAGEQISFASPGPLWTALKSSVDLWLEHYEGISRWAFTICFCLLMWLMGLVLFATFPKLASETVPGLVRQWAKNITAALLGAIAAPALLVMFIISLIGWPLIPFYLLMLLLLAMVAYLLAALWVGQRILPPKSPQKIRATSLLLGLLVLQLFWGAQLPFISWVAFIFWAMGWGALLRAAKALWK